MIAYSVDGAGPIGSHVVDELIKENVDEIAIYDNFTRMKACEYHLRTNQNHR